MRGAVVQEDDGGWECEGSCGDLEEEDDDDGEPDPDAVGLVWGWG